MNKISLGLLALILIVGVGFYARSNQKETRPTGLEQSAQLANTPSPQTKLALSANTYHDPNNMFTFSYSDGYTLDTQDPLHIRVYKRAETQRPQSEMTDGVLLVFEPIKLQGVSLETWVDERMKTTTTDGMTKIREAKQSITQNEYSGFYYATEGLETSQNMILQKTTDSDYAVMISYVVNDPEGRGYKDEVSAILSSVKFGE